MGKTSHDILTHPNLSIKADTSQHVSLSYLSYDSTRIHLKASPESKKSKNATLPSCPALQSHHPEPPPSPSGPMGCIQHCTIADSRQNTIGEPQELEKAECAQTPLLSDLLGHAAQVPLAPNFVAHLALASTTIP